MSIKNFFTGKSVSSLEEAIKKLNFSEDCQVVVMEQVHGNNIADLTASQEDIGQKMLQITGVDACFTNKKNVFLTVKSADCLPILISGEYLDSKGIIQPFIAGAHAGRKSTNAQILKKLLVDLEKRFHFLDDAGLGDANKLSIWFGPAICVDCYQINRDTNTHFDLILENKRQIAEFFDSHGMDFTNHINLEITQGCTLHEPKKYHSYRATGSGVKMNYSFIWIY